MNTRLTPDARLIKIQRDAAALDIDFRKPTYRYTLWNVDVPVGSFLGSYHTLDGAFKMADAESAHGTMCVVEAVNHANDMLQLMVRSKV
jgi:hypothetical protein